MKKLLSYVILAIGIISGYKKTIAAQKAEIERLQALIDKEEIDDAERDAKLAELQGFEAEAAHQADELARLLNDEPAVPTVNPDTFDVTAGATEQPQDLAFRELQDETRGQTAGVQTGTAVASAPQGPAGPAGGEGGEQTGDKAETAESLVEGNSREDLLTLAEKEGVEAPASNATKTDIAKAIIAKREEGAGK